MPREAPLMDILCEKYRELRLDGSLIGLERADGPAYFCTPVGAEVIGWDNGIHYCFIRGLGDTVFCVNPETCCEHYVYPIARSFRDFLGLILAVGNTNTLQQIILWDKEAYKAFVNSPHERDNLRKSEVRSALGTLRRGTGVEPIDYPFEYVKALQSDFPYEKIPFSDEYYEVLGLERPGAAAPGRRSAPADRTGD